MRKIGCISFHLCIVIILLTIMGCAERDVLLVDNLFEEYYLSGCPIVQKINHRLNNSLITLSYHHIDLVDIQSELLNDLSSYSDIRYIIYTPLFLPFAQAIAQQTSLNAHYVISFDSTIDGSIDTPTLSYANSTSQIVQHINTVQSSEEIFSMIVVTEPIASADKWVQHLFELIEQEQLPFEHSAHSTEQQIDVESIAATLDSNRFNLALILLTEHNANIIQQSSNDDITIITENLTTAFDKRIIGYISVDYCDLHAAIHDIGDNGLILEQSYVSFP